MSNEEVAQEDQLDAIVMGAGVCTCSTSCVGSA